MEDEDDSDRETTVERYSTSRGGSSYGATIIVSDDNSDKDLEQQRPVRKGMPDRRSSSMTIATQPQENIKATTTGVMEEESTRLLSTFPTLAGDQSRDSHRRPWVLIRVASRVHSFMSPPLYAAALALVVGLTPLKHVLYDKQSFLYPCLTKAVETCGKAAVPIILTCLGAQLTCISESQQSASPTSRKPVATVIFVRMILMPFLVIPISVAFVVYGSGWSTLATDPVFIIMMIILGCTPTAINLVQITQVNGVFEEEMLRMLFWSYGVVCVPVCTLLVFVALNIVDKLV